MRNFVSHYPFPLLLFFLYWCHSHFLTCFVSSKLYCTNIQEGLGVKKRATEQKRNNNKSLSLSRNHLACVKSFNYRVLFCQLFPKYSSELLQSPNKVDPNGILGTMTNSNWTRQLSPHIVSWAIARQPLWNIRCSKIIHKTKSYHVTIPVMKLDRKPATFGIGETVRVFVFTNNNLLSH